MDKMSFIKEDIFKYHQELICGGWKTKLCCVNMHNEINSTQPLKRMKPCLLQRNDCNWKQLYLVIEPSLKKTNTMFSDM